MTLIQAAIFGALLNDPTFKITEDIQRGVAQRMVRLGWLAEIAGEFVATEKGELVYRAAYKTQEEGKMFRVRFKRGLNLEVCRGISPTLPCKKEMWRYTEDTDLWVTKLFAQEGTPVQYTLFLLSEPNESKQYPDRIVNVPVDAFDIVEAKRLVG